MTKPKAIMGTRGFRLFKFLKKWNVSSTMSEYSLIFTSERGLLGELINCIFFNTSWFAILQSSIKTKATLYFGFWAFFSNILGNSFSLINFEFKKFFDTNKIAPSELSIASSMKFLKSIPGVIFSKYETQRSIFLYLLDSFIKLST